MMNYQKKNVGIDLLMRSKKIGVFLIQRLLQLSLADKMIVGGAILALFSLFMKWIIFSDTYYNSFHNLTGSNGYLLFVLVILLLFVTISIHYKQKIKLHSGLAFNDYHVAIIVGVLLIILPVNSLIFLIGLSTFTQPGYGSGIGLCITAGILVLSGAILKKKYINNTDTSLHTSSLEEEKVSDHDVKDNMKLPF